MKLNAFDEGAPSPKRVQFALPSSADGRPSSSSSLTTTGKASLAAPDSDSGREDATPSVDSVQEFSGLTTLGSEMQLSRNAESTRTEKEKAFTSAAISLNDDWQLTWPIWHMLPRWERKEIAAQHGYKTIGEFEEFMSLQRAVGETSGQSKPYESQLAYNTSPTEAVQINSRKEPTKTRNDVVSEEEEEQQGTDREEVERLAAEHADASAPDSSLSPAELRRLGGNILILPEDMLHRVFDWLPVDAYATLALVSPHWRSFTRTEAVYKKLCERLYLNQSKRRALHVNRFGNSYRTMLEKRPRVRAGGGVYVLKYCKVQPIQRDMWTEVSTRRTMRSRVHVGPPSSSALTVSVFRNRSRWGPCWSVCITGTSTSTRMDEFCTH
jgi:F-box-like